MRRKLNCQNKKIAIMGGTFDPIHIGHLAIAQEALEYMGLDKVIFIPAGFPPHKDRDITPGEKRLDMVKLAIEENDGFIVSDYEVRKQTKSYSMETIEYIKNNNQNCDFYFIMGEDSFMSIETWYEYEKFLSEISVLVARRSYSNIIPLREKISKLVEKGYYIKEIPAVFLDISSTYIRDKYSNGKSAEYYLPKNVNEYILKEDLYGQYR